MAEFRYTKVKEYLEEIAARPESALRMPSVRELMKQFGVSLATVNKALSLLEADGVITRRQGAGIVSARHSGPVHQPEPQTPGKKILLAYIDYPSERVWELVFSTRYYIRQNGMEALDFRILQNTCAQTLVEFASQTTDLSGVVLLPGAASIESWLTELQQLQVPVAIMDSMYFYDPLPESVRCFSPDPADWPHRMVAYLVARGHRKIGYLRNEPWNDYCARFQQELLNAFENNGIAENKDNVISAAIRPWENSMDAAYNLTRAKIDEIRRKGITALIYKSSPGAQAGLRALAEAGVRVPEEISVISEGERQAYRYLTPGLTNFYTSAEDMAKASVDFVSGRSTPKEPHTFIPLKFMERESVWDRTAQAAPAPARRSKKKSEGGFTLVEMLVVISVIAILAGLLLPAMQGALTTASVISCSNNMRNISIGLFSYSDSNGGNLITHNKLAPIATVGVRWDSSYWMWVMATDYSVGEAAFNCSKHQYAGTDTANYVPGMGVRNAHNVSSVGMTNYAMNGMMLATKDSTDGWAKDEIGGRISRSNIPSRCLLLLEYLSPIAYDGADGYTSKVLSAFVSNPERIRDHGAGRCNFVMLDGHAESITFPNNPTGLVFNGLRENVYENPPSTNRRMPIWKKF